MLTGGKRFVHVFRYDRVLFLIVRPAGQQCSNRAEGQSDQRRRLEEARAARRAEKHAGRAPKGAKASDGESAGENA